MRVRSVRPASRRRSPRRAPGPLPFAGPLEPRVLLASAELLADLNLYTDDSGPTSFAAGAGGVAYFSAFAPATGRELYKTNGTAAGTSLVKDILPGAGSSLYRPDQSRLRPAPQFTAVGSTTFFVADNGSQGAELWKTDGTAAGTVMVKDIYTGGGGSYPEHLTAVGNTLYFVARQPDQWGHQLWQSDGTATGTRLVTIIQGGFDGPGIDQLTASGGKVYFAADHPTEGRLLWVSDGTAAGTRPFTDPFAGGARDPANLIDAGGTLYFSGIHATGTRSLYKTTGTTGSPTLVSDVPVDETVAPARLGTHVYFASGGSDRELYKTDGTLAGTVRVADLLPGPDAGGEPRDLTVLGQHLYFSASTVHPSFGFPVGRQVVRTDGTAAGTALVTLLGFAPQGADPFGLAAANGRLFFGANGLELYVTNGVPFDQLGASTTVVQEIPFAARQFPTDWRTVLGTRLIYAGVDRPAGVEPRAADGVAAPVRLMDVNTDTVSSYPAYPPPLVLGSKMYFTADNGTHGREMWVTDGTSAGTVRLTDAAPGELDGVGGSLTALNGRVYFAAYDGASRASIRSTDGTVAGTRVSIDLAPLGVDRPYQIAALNGSLYFLSLGLTAEQGYQFHLFKTDGTQAGTTLVTRVKTYQSQGTAGWQVVNGLLYFVVSGGGGLPAALWRSDGTAAGTYVLREWGYNDYAFDFVEMGGLVYFIQGPSGSTTLWAADGTVEGTLPITDGMGLDVAHLDKGLVPYRGRLYFTARSGSEVGVYRTDGTRQGTTRVDLPGWTPGSGLQAYNDRLYYRVDDADRRGSLYRSDGTAAGTALVYAPGTGPGAGYGVSHMTLFEANDMLLFPVRNGPAAGSSLHWYATDGTTAGTSEITGAYQAGYFATQVGSRVLFTGEAPGKGEEWFRTTLPDTARPAATDARLAANGNAHVVRVTFTEDLAPASLTASDLVLTDLSTGNTVPTPFSAVSFDSATDTATFTVNTARFPNGRLPVGHYRVSLAAGAVADPSGNTSAAPAQFELTVSPAPSVAARHVFYNGSSLDGRDTNADARDDAAIAADKQALPAGGTASFANVTNYTRGINGIMVDIAGLPADTTPWAGDFLFRRIGGTGPDAFLARAAASVTVRRGAGAGGSDRVTIALPDAVVRNGWLEVTVRPNARTGLAAPQVFTFGNLVGDTGGAGAPKVDAADVLRTRANLGRTTAAALATYDFNRDGAINAADVMIVRNNQGRTLPVPNAPAVVAAAAVVVQPVNRVPTRPSRRGVLGEELPGLLA